MGITASEKKGVITQEDRPGLANWPGQWDEATTDYFSNYAALAIARRPFWKSSQVVAQGANPTQMGIGLIVKNAAQATKLRKLADGIEISMTGKVYASPVDGYNVLTAVRGASGANINIASAPATVGGVTPNAADRFLLYGQTDPTENGIYTWAAESSAMTRATDANTFAELAAASVTVSEGTDAGKTFYQTTASGVIDADNVVWTPAKEINFGGAVAAITKDSKGLPTPVAAYVELPKIPRDYNEFEVTITLPLAIQTALTDGGGADVGIGIVYFSS